MCDSQEVATSEMNCWGAASIISSGLHCLVSLAFAVSVPQKLFSAISEGTLAVIKSMVNGPRNNQINHFLRFRRKNDTLISADDER
jgi:hypothetical protein